MSEGPITVDTFRALQDEAGAEFVSELVDAFLEEGPAMLDALRASLAARDNDTFRRSAHTLKSNSLTFGADRLAALARDLEARAAEIVLDGDAAVVGPVAHEYARVATALRDMQHG
jgi:histidine phosphotransfer protein HptB